MSEFKFNQPERHNVERLLQQVRHMGLSVIEGVDRIEQIISARGESDGWVSVEDGLPDKEQQVSIVVTGNSACVGYIHERGHWIIQSLTSSYKENSLHNVTHWQPRPSPPKPDQQ